MLVIEEKAGGESGGSAHRQQAATEGRQKRQRKVEACARLKIL